MTENELLLIDRIDVIRKMNDKYDLNKNAYISFSGGKDSTVLHYLIDEALPGNTIPRVYSNTGIEYKLIVDFVNEMKAKDNRIEIIYPRKKIKEMLETVGYPFKSKEHSTKLYEFQIGHRNTKSNIKYREGDGNKSRFACPKILKYQFTDDFKMKISYKCCHELKKKPFAKYSKQTGRTIALTGMQKSEGGQRLNTKCIVTKNGEVVKFHPLLPTTEEFEEWFIRQNDIKLCRLYYPPYNFARTGCKGCPYALNLQEELDILEMYFPAEKKQCEYIWEPVYKEYRRLGYRLRKDDIQTTIWEFL